MLKTLKQVRAAVGLLNPDEVRRRAQRPVSIGLVASTGGGYGEMEEFLIPPWLPPDTRRQLMNFVHRASDPGVPGRVDLVLYEQGIPCPKDAFVFYGNDLEATIAGIIDENDELALPLARQFPAFRKPVIGRMIHAVSRENALFSVATALPNVVPNLIELPWAFGEFASDTVFLTVNQVRMAFLIAAACDKEVGYSHQKAEILSLAAGAFGWRAIARELSGKIPFGEGLIPKGAIAYAGTYIVGKGLERYHHANAPLTKHERDEAYQHALERGKSVAQSLSAEVKPP